MKKFFKIFITIFIFTFIIFAASSCDETPKDETSNIKETFTVKWKNYNGIILEVDENVEYGSIPEYNGSTPIKETDSNYKYIFDGWDKEIKSVTSNIEYYAVYKNVPFSNCVVTFDSDGGTNIDSKTVLKGEKVSKPSTPEKRGNTFVGWYYGDDEWSFIGYVVTEDMTLKARWQKNRYSLMLNSSDYSAGGVSSAYNSYYYNDQVTIIATTNPGYNFLGWYDNNGKLINESPTYTFTMPDSNVFYTAKWSVNDNITYKVLHYLENIDNNQYTLEETEVLTGTTNTQTNASAKEYEGFIVNNFNQAIINGSGNTQVVIYYKRITKQISLSKNIDSAGSISGSGTFKYGKTVSLLAQTYLGYLFLGWYDNDDELVSLESNLTYLIEDDINISLKAKFILDDDMSNYEFTSTTDTCVIKGVKDKTVKEILIPNYISCLGSDAWNYAFDGCSLNAVYYNGTIEDWCNIKINNDYSQPMRYSSYFYILDTHGDVEYNNKKYSLLTELEIPESVKTIKRIQFYCFKNIKKIIIPSSVELIENNSFYLCSLLEDIIIKKGITDISQNAFEACTSLKNVYYTGTINDWVKINMISTPSSNPLYYAQNLYILDENGTVEYDNQHYSLVTEAVITEDITTFSYNFCGYDNLERLVLPDSLTYLGSLYNCNLLINIRIPKNVIKLVSFEKCTALKNVYYDGTIEDWFNIDFQYTKNSPMLYAKNFYILDENGDVEYEGHKYSLLTDLEIPNTVTSLKYNLFGFNCIKNLIIPESVNYLTYEDQVASLTSLKNITIPSSIKGMGKAAFSNDPELENVYYDGTIEDWCNITLYDDYESTPMCYAKNFYILDENGDVEYNNKKYSLLEELVIPSSISTIYNYKFAYFDCLKKVTISDSVKQIEKRAFSGCDNLETVIIGNGVRLIEQYSFYSCDSLNTVIIGNSVTNIYFNAFHYCSNLVNVVIGSSVEVIGDQAFYYCNKIENIYYNGTMEKWLEIDFKSSSTLFSNYNNINHSFYILYENGDIDFYGNKYKLLTEIVIPSSITKINNYQFYCFNKITNIFIPNSITSIGYYAFDQCSALQKIYYDGNKEDFESLFNENYYRLLNLNIIYYYSEEEPQETGKYWHYVENEIVEWN